MSGALPITMASMSAIVVCALSSARSTASRTKPAIDTSARHDVCLVWPTPITAQRAAMSVTFQDADEVLLQPWPGRRVAKRSIGRTVGDARRRLGDAGQPCRHHRVGA